MESLILLHGALGTSKQFDFIFPLLKEHFDVHRINFEGHGEAGPTESTFRISYFVENVLGYMDEHRLKKANFFGYSMGGYVALSLAKDYPERVKGVSTLGTILQWNEEIADRESKYLHPQKMKEKVPHFVDKLKDKHLSGWERVVNNTRDMLQYLGVHPSIEIDEWKQIDCPIRFHIGDSDTTAGLEQTIAAYRKTDNSEMMVLPGTGHPIHDVEKDLLVHSLRQFFTNIEKSHLNNRAQKTNGSNN